MFPFLKDGRAYSGYGSKYEDYYCYGQPVLTPADGTVVLVNNTFADNVPGHVEEIMPTGNSGTSCAAHFEYRLQNSSGLPLPETVPAQFIDYVADGAPVTIGEPLRGQTVHNASPPPATTAVATAPAPEKK